MSRVQSGAQCGAMKLTRYTDYALRVMVHLANTPEGLVAIHALAKACDAPENHIMKVTPALVRGGLVNSTRGRGGGLRLAKDPADIRVGEIVSLAEGRFDLGDCAQCGLESCCTVRGVLSEAGDAFIASLNRHTLADLIATQGQTRHAGALATAAAVPRAALA